MNFSKQAWELNITTRACFHVYHCSVAILFEIAVFSSFHRDTSSGSGGGCSGTRGPGLLGSTGCLAVLVALLTQVLLHRRDGDTHKHPRSEQKRSHNHPLAHKHVHTCKKQTQTPRSPPHTTWRLGFHVRCPKF